MKDIIERASKTFVQAFFGCLVPSIASSLSGGFPEDWNEIWLILSPIIAASVAAGISAVWNIIKEKIDKA